MEARGSGRVGSESGGSTTSPGPSADWRWLVASVLGLCLSDFPSRTGWESKQAW